MTTAAIIVAAGRGLRAGGGVPKQWRDLAGSTVAEHALRTFHYHPKIDRLVLVVHSDDMGAAYWPLNLPAEIVVGGATRVASVLAGLKALEGACTHVLIHDAARACVSPALIDRVVDALATAPRCSPRCWRRRCTLVGQERPCHRNSKPGLTVSRPDSAGF